MSGERPIDDPALAAGRSERRILGHSGWLAGAQVLTAVLAVAQAVMLTRALGAASYGVLALIVAYTLTVSQILSSRVWEAIIRFVPRYQERGERGRAAATFELCTLIELAAGLVSVAVVLATAGLAERLLIKDPGAASLLRMFAVVILLNVPHEATSALLRLADRFRWLAFHAAAVAVLRTAGIALAWWLDPTVRSMLIVQLAAAAVGIAILMAMGYRGVREAGLPLWRRSPIGALGADLRELLRFIFLTNLTGTSRIVTTHADTLVLGLLGTPATVGVYELAKRIIAQLRGVSNAIYETSYPEISKLIVRGGLEVVERLQAKLSRTLLAATVPVCAAGTLVAPWVIPAVFGAEFSPSVPLFQILVWQLLWLPLVWFPGFLLATGRVWILTAISWLDALFLVLLLFALVPGWLAIGAAAATVLRYFLWVLMAGATLRALRRRDAAGVPPDAASV